MPPVQDLVNTPDQIVLFHLSDLHIGTALMPSPDEFHKYRAGFNTHDFRLLQPLELALAHARRRLQMHPSEPMEVVISGDLTQSGTDNDYATAMALLHERWRWRFGEDERWLGFGWPRGHVHTVPGNHDHWRHARFPTAFSRELARSWFEPTPWRHVIRSRGGTIELELYGVDSNSGLEDPASPGKPNPFAGGEVSTFEIEELKRRLQSADAASATDGPAVLRAIVCHHAFSPAGWWLDAKPLRQRSRDKLCGLALEFGIAAVLTGHTHEFKVEDWPHKTDLGSCVLKELRCGTTLQGQVGEMGRQSFLVHRIERLAGSLTCRWTAWRYQFGGKAFDVDEEDPITFLIPPPRTRPGC
jgi:hypothetical protein